MRHKYCHSQILESGEDFFIHQDELKPNEKSSAFHSHLEPVLKPFTR